MKPFVIVLAGAVGGVVGALITQATHTAPAARTTRESAPDTDPALVQRLESLERSVARLAREDAPGPATEDVPEAPEPKPDGDGAASRVPGTPGDGAANLKLATLVATVTQGPFDQKKVNGMWAWMTQNQKSIGSLIKSLQAELKKNPNAELYTALATAYVGELNYATTPGAPQGLVWAKASQAYDQAIAMDNEHWQARFGKAFGTTFIPAQFGSRPAAIKQFEALREIQERRAPEAQFAQTYTQLGRLYAGEGNHQKAREIWRAGLDLFPQNTSLKGQLEVSEKK